MGDEPLPNTAVKRKWKTVENDPNDRVPVNKHTCSSPIASQSSCDPWSVRAKIQGQSSWDPWPQGGLGVAMDGVSVIQQSTTLNGSSVINKTDKVMAEATKMMDQLEFLTSRYNKLLAINAAQSKDLETLNFTCKKQCVEINGLKTLLVDKDKTEQQARIAREKISELENKLKAKEEEVGRVDNKLEEVGNSLMDRMKRIQKKLDPLYLLDVDDYGNSETSKIDELQNRMNQPEEQLAQKQALESEIKRVRGSLNITGDIEDGDYINILRKLEKTVNDLTDELMHVKALNECLVARDRLSSDQLQVVRNVLITEFCASRSTIGIKGMGQLDTKPFKDECRKKLGGGNWELESMKLLSLWQEHIKNPEWRPFKIENNRRIIDEDDERLKELRNEWGDMIYKAVTDALVEMYEYNPDRGYIVSELWNFNENRKASIKEAIELLICKLKRSYRVLDPPL